MLQPGRFLIGEDQAELGAAPEDVVRAGRPFLTAQIIHFPRVQVLAYQLAQLVHRARFAQHAPDPAAVKACPAPRQRQVDALDLRHQLFGQRIGAAQVFAARQRCASRPASAHVREKGRELHQRRLGQFAISGELAAEYREQRRLVLFGRQGQGVVTGDHRRVVRLVVTQRPHAGEGMQDVLALQLLAEMRVGHTQQIGDLFLADARLRRVAVVFAVGGADHGVAAHVGDGEDDAAVLVLHDVGLLALVQSRHDDMAALDQANAVRRALLQVIVDELRHPGAGGVDQRLGAQGETGAVFALQLDVPDAAGTPGAQALGAGVDVRAFLAGGHGVEHHQSRVVDPAVGIFESAPDRRLQRAIVAKAQAARGGELPALAEVVVEEQAGPDHPRGAQVRPMWQHEAHRLDQVRRLGQQHFAFGQRFADQAELVMFEVAQPSVDQLAAGGGGVAGKVVALAEEYRKSAPGRIGGNARAVDPAADDGDIVELGDGAGGIGHGILLGYEHSFSNVNIVVREDSARQGFGFVFYA